MTLELFDCALPASVVLQTLGSIKGTFNSFLTHHPRSGHLTSITWCVSTNSGASTPRPGGVAVWMIDVRRQKAGGWRNGGKEENGGASHPAAIAGHQSPHLAFLSGHIFSHGQSNPGLLLITLVFPCPIISPSRPITTSPS